MKPLASMKTMGAAALLPTLLCVTGAAPATGESVKVLPWILGGIGLVAVVALIALSALDAKKKKNAPPPGNTPPAAPPNNPDNTPHDDMP